MTHINNQNSLLLGLMFSLLISLYMCIFLLENIFQFYIYSQIPGEAKFFNLAYKMLIISIALATLAYQKYYLKIDREIVIVLYFYALISIILIIISKFEYIGYIISILYSSIILLFTYFLFKYKLIQAGNALTLFFTINGLWLLSQVFGLSEFLYFFQNYVQVVGDEKFDFVLFLQTDNKDIVPAQQFRPSGLFTNTIYLSLFLITYFGYLIFNKSNSTYHRYLFAGFIIPFSGSTMVIVYGIVSFLSLFYNKKMVWFIFGFLFSLFILYYYFPVFFDTNFNFENTLSSIKIRMDINVAHKNSFFAENLIFSSISLVLILMFFIRTLISNKSQFLAYFLLVFIALTPLILHPIFQYSGYTFLLGLLFACSSNSNDSNRQYVN